MYTPIIGYLLVFLGINTFVIFIFHREWLLQKQSFKILFVIDVFLMIIAYLFPGDNFVSTFKGALIQLLLYRLVHYVFVEITKREPKNTFWAFYWEKGLWKDVIFNFITCFSLLLACMLAIDKL